ncbi:MAG: iron-sulfur cluster repair protein YtfE [Brachymonas sp.]
MSISNPALAISPEWAIGQIAVDIPGATAVFRRLKIDFCCGGQVSLRQATADKGLDLQAVMDELAALKLPNDAPSFDSPSRMIDHIISRYHDVHRAQLPELLRMAHRVEAVHKGKPQVPAGLEQALEAMHNELLSHMQKEELVLFPSLKAGGNPYIAQPIAMMRHEHTDHGAALEHIVALTHDMTPPADACNTWRALYAGLNQLRDDLISHIHLENNILFPLFENAAPQGGCASSGCGCA